MELINMLIQQQISGNFGNGSGGSVPAASIKGVNFYDYDGTLLHSYSVEEVQELTELPEPPSHEGLVCQGWNYTLDDIKAQNNMVDVGAMYITDDGKTRFYISIDNDSRMIVPICFGQTVANGVTVDWGDGSTETFDGTGTLYIAHEYSSVGDYVITLGVQDDCTLTLGGGNSYQCVVGGTSTSKTYLHIYSNMLKRAELGNNTSFAVRAFEYCYSLTSITIPSSVTSIANQAFDGCQSLTWVTIPSSVTSIGNTVFSNCYSLTSVIIPSSVKTIGGSIFMKCYNLTSVIIPLSVTSIDGYMFRDCYSLTSVTIPSSVTNMGNGMFQGCYNLTSVTLSPSLTTIGQYTFQNCYSLTSIDICHGVKSIGYNAFNNCYSLASVTFPSSVTSIDGSSFASCYSLASITIPSSVTNIGSSAFSGCQSLTSVTIPEGSSITLNSSSFYACKCLGSFIMPIISNFSSDYFRGCPGLAYLDFTHYSSVPTLTNSSHITGINDDCKIRVPAALYDEWIAATNWSAVADRIVAV